MSNTDSHNHLHRAFNIENVWQQDEIYQSIWEHASDAMVLSAPDGTVIAANPAYFHLYGYAPEQVIGQNYTIIFPPEQRAWAQQLYTYVFESPSITPSFETPITRSDGTVRIVDSHYTFLTQNGVRYAMLSIIRDVTEQKQREEALRESELKLRLALEVGRMVTWNLDVAANTLHWSANLEEVLGLPPGKGSIAYQAFLELVDARDRALIEQELAKALEEGADLQVEFRMPRPDGTTLWASAYGQVLFDEENKPMRMIGICTDITAHKQGEEQARQHPG